jgi:hypothetical protein
MRAALVRVGAKVSARHTRPPTQPSPLKVGGLSAEFASTPRSQLLPPSGGRSGGGPEPTTLTNLTPSPPFPLQSDAHQELLGQMCRPSVSAVTGAACLAAPKGNPVTASGPAGAGVSICGPRGASCDPGLAGDRSSIRSGRRGFKAARPACSIPKTMGWGSLWSACARERACAENNRAIPAERRW